MLIVTGGGVLGRGAETDSDGRGCGVSDVVVGADLLGPPVGASDDDEQAAANNATTVMYAANAQTRRTAALCPTALQGAKPSRQAVETTKPKQLRQGQLGGDLVDDAR